MTPGRNLSNGRLNITLIELDYDSLRIIALAQCRLFCDIWAYVFKCKLNDLIWLHLIPIDSLFAYMHHRLWSIAYVYKLSSDRYNPRTLNHNLARSFFLMNPKELK